jgi:LysR family transcriptional regulator, cell division regulator
MDARDLRIFEAVARLGGMNRAAVELHTVQSNVTARIRLLEDELGAALFERTRRGVTLTAAGQRLLPYARRVAAVIADARRAVADDGNPKGSLAVGSLETTAAVRLPPVLARFAATYPEVDLSLVTGTTAELTRRVLTRAIEGAFVCGPVDHPGLDHEVVFREELTLLTAASVRSLDAVMRAGEPRIIVLRAGCSYRQRLEAILSRRGVLGPRRLEFGTIEGILGCVAAGLGVTLLPKAVVSDAWRKAGVRLHDLPAREARVDTLFIARRGDRRSSALAAFLDMARPPRRQAAE